MQFTPYHFLALATVLFLGFPPDILAGQKIISDRLFKQINMPQDHTLTVGKKIIVAIVDDGIRTTHKDLREFIWQNPFEIPGNFIDDDGNGQIDDVNGWDVADNNPTVAPPESRLLEYYHGTHLAGIVIQIARATFGSKASEAIAIMPVKVLADEAENTAIKYGYQGIDYAVRAGADIILCAWSVGHISMEEKQILANAREKGVFIIGSAGNFPDERDMFPAAANSVLAIASLDENNRLTNHSNYGSFVDLSAPGDNISSSSTRSDEAYLTNGGTSQAAAIVAGATAAMMSHSPDASNITIKACLKNSSTLLEPQTSNYSAKQGAGLLNIKAAVACLDADSLPPATNQHPQGYLDLSAAKGETKIWTIEPTGKFKGIWFNRPEMDNASVQASIDFYTGNTSTGKILASFSLNSMPERFFVPGTRATVALRGQSDVQPRADLLMEYRTEAIDFRTLFCSSTKHLYEEGTIADGSGDQPYSNGSDCKWQITAPEDKVVHFKFTNMDTEPNTDFVYFFNGEGTHEKIMAIFSGQNIPPELTTWGNKVLVWFVTNGENQGQGWKGEFTFIDKEKAQYPTLPEPVK